MPAIPSALYRRAANGTGSDELLFAGEGDELLVPMDWSPDGHFLVFGRSHIATWASRSDLWTLELTGEHTARPLIESPFVKGSAHLSPNGHWIAYFTNESNTNQIVVQPFPNVGQGKWQVSTHGGMDPKWRGDGRELYYMAPNGDVMAVDVDTTADVFTSGPPHRLFATGITIAPPPATARLLLRRDARWPEVPAQRTDAGRLEPNDAERRGCARGPSARRDRQLERRSAPAVRLAPSANNHRSLATRFVDAIATRRPCTWG